MSDRNSLESKRKRTAQRQESNQRLQAAQEGLKRKVREMKIDTALERICQNGFSIDSSDTYTLDELIRLQKKLETLHQNDPIYIQLQSDDHVLGTYNNRRIGVIAMEDCCPCIVYWCETDVERSESFMTFIDDTE